MSLLYGPSQGTAKSNLLAALRETGGVRLEASYSGGNDEGGVTGMKILDAEGNQIEVSDTITRQPTADDSKWMIQADGLVHDDHPVWRAADEMLATEFYTWAGEFSAWGTLFATTADGKVWREGEMQSGYDADDAEY